MIRVSKAEITHLLAGLAVFFVVEASRFAPFSFEAMLVPFLATVFAFGVHEFSHKYAAQSFGFWSEFRVDPVMAIASLLTSLTRFKVIAPGSVLIRGYSVKRSHMGVIAFAGPAMNVLLAFAFKIVSYFLPIALQVALVNADIAFFNLLPGGFFDGKKIFDWDKRAWIGLFAASAALWLFIVLVP